MLNRRQALPLMNGTIGFLAAAWSAWSFFDDPIYDIPFTLLIALPTFYLGYELTNNYRFFTQSRQDQASASSSHAHHPVARTA